MFSVSRNFIEHALKRKLAYYVVLPKNQHDFVLGPRTFLSTTQFAKGKENKNSVFVSRDY